MAMKSPFADNVVLVIDEDWFTAKLMSSVLQAFETGQIKTARSYDEAREIIDKNDVDCIMCDWLTGDVNRLKLVDDVRRRESKEIAEVPVVLFTGYTELDKIIAARDSGVHEIVAKPVTPRQVMHKLYSALNSKRDFVRSEAYCGPDRRRRAVPFDGVDRRGELRH